MRIAIDIREAFGKRVGKGQYVFSLLKALTEIDPQSEYLLFTNTDDALGLPLPKNFQLVVKKLPATLWHLWAAWQICFSKKFDIYFAPTSFIAPALAWRKRCVIAVMDMVAFLGITKHKKKAVFFEKLFLKKAAHKALQILAISKNTKGDLVRIFDIPAEKVTVSYIAAAPALNKTGSEETQEALRRLLPGVEPGYLFFVGTIEPRKNVLRMLKAYKKVLDLKGEKMPKFVVAGKKGWHYEEVYEFVEANEYLKKKVAFLDYLEARDIAAVYSGASIFLFPSLYEGFGIPVLEAMQCGIPVVTSASSSLPEVAGNAAYMVDPRSVDEIAGAIRKLLSSPILREALVGKGFERAREFNWQKTAKETLGVFKKTNENI